MKTCDRHTSLLGLALAIAIASAALLLAPAAMASRTAGPINRKALRGAVQRSSQVPGNVRRGHFHLRGAGQGKDPRHPVLSTAGPWAAATIVPTVGGLDSVVAVFRRHHGHPRWSLHQLGTAEVGCSLPRAVVADLGLSC